MRKIVLTITILSVIGLSWWALRDSQEAPPVQASVSVAQAMTATSTAGFARAETPREFRFPTDHGPHPEFRSEWWYFTGNLDTADGRHFGYQLTFFRNAMLPDSTQRNSDWAARQFYMGHFALTDVASGQFYADERFSRAAFDLAGAQATPFRVWLEDWQTSSLDDSTFALQAATEAVAIELEMALQKPPVLQGQQGLSQKGRDIGNASYYYSLTRIQSQGTIQVGSDTFSVAGLSWMDREWSTSALDAQQVGWDWFALQMADTTEIMYYQLRLQDGSPDSLSKGTFVQADGTYHLLTQPDVTLTVLDTWRNPRNGIEYPAKWRLHVPKFEIDYTITPYMADQELNVSVRYWEGAVRIEGQRRGQAVRGDGYVELTGYGDPVP